MMDTLLQFFSDYTYRTVMLGSAVLGIISGTLGSFAVLRKQSLLGDAVSHAALPGVALAFLITQTKSLSVMLAGAFISGLLATLFVHSITRRTRIKDDSALGLVLSFFFGFGLVLLTMIQKMPNASQSGLEKFLFGQAATLMMKDVWLMVGISIVLIGMTVLFWKEFKLMSFDPGYCQSVGFNVKVLDILMTLMLVITIVIGLQTVGVILMSAMIVAPVAAARQWTDRLWVMVVLSAVFGAFSGVAGALTSSVVDKMPTGPTIIIWISGIVVVSMLLAPNRGLVWKKIKDTRNRRKIQEDAVLEDFFYLYKHHGRVPRGHTLEVLRVMSLGHGGADGSVVQLKAKGLIEQKGELWNLTGKGIQTAVEQFEKEGDAS